MGFAFADSLAATAGAASLLAESGFAGTPGRGSGGSGDEAATSLFADAAGTPGSGSGGGSDAVWSAAGRSSPGNGRGASAFLLSAAELEAGGPEGGSAPGSVRPGPGSASDFPSASSCVSFALTFCTFAGSASGSFRYAS